ncbi:MAG: hypothetical protein WCK86_00985 [Planctomycetia bacterium]
MRHSKRFGIPLISKASAECAVIATCLTLQLPSLAAQEPERQITNTARFEIPFEVNSDPAEPVEGFAVLYGSQNSGKTWERLQSVPIAKGKFVFTAPRDGHYSFAIRMTDARGSLLTPIEGSAPEMDVFVDTVPPVLKLEITEPSAGHAIVTWTTADPSVDPATMTLEYTDGVSGVRKKVECTPTASGQARLPLPPGSSIQVRAAITDNAGNRGEVKKQYVSDIEPGTASTADPEIPVADQEKPAAPIGVSPFFQDAPAATAQQPAVPEVKDVPVVRRPDPPKVPTLNSRPDRKNQTSPQPSTNQTPIIPPPLPAPSEPVPALNGVQMVNNRVFNIEYQIDDVGPSGISSVELFVTEDGGKQWFRYGVDQDMKSPFQVDSMAEGTFGFAVRVRNGAGLADIPPQPGQPPEIMISVDQTLPFIEMAQPTVSTEGEGAIRFSWQIVETNPAENSIRLESAQSPNGPWLPVFDWQPDTGSHELAVRSGLPAQMYFRLLARDTAGNIATSQTIQPVVVDLKRPVGRLLRVQPAATPGSVRTN